MRTFGLLCTWCAVLLLGCSSETMGAPVPPAMDDTGTEPQVSFLGQVRASTTFVLSRDYTSMTLVARLPSAEPPREAVVGMGLLAGAASVHATAEGQIVVESLDFVLEDVHIGDELLPPDGATLTDLRVRLAEPAAGLATWDAQSGVAEIPVSLLFDWSVMTSRGPAPLAQQQIDDLMVTVQVRDDVGTLALEMDARVDGTLFAWSSFAEIGDLDMGLLGFDQGAPELE